MKHANKGNPRSGRRWKRTPMKVALGAMSLAASIGGVAQAEDGWTVNTYLENDTHYRGEDATGETVGLSKLRNTLQLEAARNLGSGWKFNAVLRGTYDGVYDLNSDQYGKDAGGSVYLGNTAGTFFDAAGLPFLNTTTVPHGGGLNQEWATILGLPSSNTFGFNSTDPNAPLYNPNQGMRLLGDRWHPIQAGGFNIAVPVRPCNVDKRGCVNLGGYGDLSEDELAAPEFNDRLDFIREFYVRNTFNFDNGQQIYTKIGRQQVVWGRTDLFRVLDVINPVDYSRNNIYDELEDIRIPMWMVQTEYRMGAIGSLPENNLQLVWNFDKFRPNNLGQCGTANVALDAGCAFRAYKSLWDYGATVANFASASSALIATGSPAAPAPGPIDQVDPLGYVATDFGPGQLGLRDVHLPGWSLGNTQIGLKYEGVTEQGLSFSLNGLYYRSQLPSLHSINGEAQNPFIGTPGNLTGIPVGFLPAFDLYYPRLKMFGGSMDFQSEKLKTAFRFEAAYTIGEEFANTLSPTLYSKNNVVRTVIGIDRPTFVPLISPNRTMLISGQIFYQHIFDHQLEQSPLGETGMPDWEDNVTATLLLKALYLNDRLSPQLVIARDFEAQAMVYAPQVEYIFTDHLRASIGANIKDAKVERYQFDDCRSCNPYPPFTPYYAGGQGPDTPPGSLGLSSFEPLGRFRAGPLGAADTEDEVFFKIRYSF